MLKLSLGDLWRGLLMAMLGPVILAVTAVTGAVIMDPNFDAFSSDYILLFKNLTNAFIVAAYSSGVGYLVKNLLTNDNHDFLGIKTKT